MAKTNQQLKSRVEAQQQGSTSPSGDFDGTPASFNAWLESTKRQYMEHMKALMCTNSETEVIAIFEGFREQCRRNPDLLKCTPASLRSCFVKSAETHLTPGAMQECAYVPFYNSSIKRHEAVWIPMYQGLIKLAYNSGFVKSINAGIVYDNDFFEFELGSQQFLRHIPSLEDQHRGNRRCVWVVIKTKYDHELIRVFSMRFIRQIMGKSRAAKSNSSPWAEDSEIGFDPMAIKTGIRQGCKLIPKSARLATAIQYDEESETGQAPIIDLTPEPTENGHGSDFLTPSTQTPSIEHTERQELNLSPLQAEPELVQADQATAEHKATQAKLLVEFGD